jgi:hypothetical protein
MRTSYDTLKRCIDTNHAFFRKLLGKLQGVVGIAPIAVVFPSYLRRRAAFHFAQRARWAAAIRLRAAVDIGLRFFTA